MEETKSAGFAAVPYKGDEPYIFISYSHKDKERILPLLTEMQQDGYRIWFDEGIDPGTEWDQNIADHIEKCGYFLAFVSESYLQSDNCKDELNFARDLNKSRVLVYLEQVTLPKGMAMRLNRIQAIHYYSYPTQKRFFKKLYETDQFDSCCEMPEPEVTPEPEETPAAEVPNPEQPEPATKEKKPVKQKRERTRKRAGKPRKRRKIILIIAAAVVVLAVLAVILIGSLSGSPVVDLTPKVTIAGYEYPVDVEYISLENKQLTEADNETLTNLENLQSLYLSGCTFNDEWLPGVLQRLTGTLEMSDCGLTNDRIEFLGFSGLQVRELILTGNKELTDLQPLASLSGSLEKLSFDGCAVSDLSFLSGFQALTYLNASGNAIEDIAALKECTQLQYLDISGNPLTKTAPPKGMGVNGVVYLHSLASLKGSLQHLAFNNCNVSDISFLKGFDQLTELYAAGNKITDLSALSGCTQIKELNVSDNQLKSLAGVEPLIYLNLFYAHNNALTDIRPLENTTLLTSVSLSGNTIQDISLLANSKGSLKELWLADNDIADISPLRTCLNLTTLNVSGNQLTALSALKGHKKLVNLWASHNRIADISALADCTELKNIDLSYNAITSTEGLQMNPSYNYNDVTLDLSHNRIIQLVIPPISYKLILIFGNPITDFESLYAASDGEVVMDYSEKMDYDRLDESRIRPYVIFDCPLNRRVAVEQALGADRTTFTTEEEFLKQEN